MQQIDSLTSSIDLNEEQQQTVTGGHSAKSPGDCSSSSGSSSKEVTVGRPHQRPSMPEDRPETTESSGTLRRDPYTRSRSPPSVQLSTVASEFLSDRGPNLWSTSSLGSSPRQGGLQQYNKRPPSSGLAEPQNLTSNDLSPSPQRSLPVRPPTPGLSPLTVNLHHTNSPGSRPHSPGPASSVKVSPSNPLSPKPQAPPTLCPSVIIESKLRSYQTPQSDHPSVGQPCPPVTQPPPACGPPTDSETQTVSNDNRELQASSAESINRFSQAHSVSAATTKPPTAQDRKGRKPPPYPHHRPSENTKKVKEPRKAPPYPEKRRLLSTTV